MHTPARHKHAPLWELSHTDEFFSIFPYAQMTNGQQLEMVDGTLVEIVAPTIQVRFEHELARIPRAIFLMFLSSSLHVVHISA
jgi:hypothetical protein